MNLEDLLDEGMKNAMTGHPDSMNVSVSTQPNVKKSYYEISRNPKWFLAVGRFFSKLHGKPIPPVPDLTLFFYLDDEYTDLPKNLGQYLVYLANKYSVVTYSGYEIAALPIITNGRSKAFMIFKKDFYVPNQSTDNIIEGGAYQL